MEEPDDCENYHQQQQQHKIQSVQSFHVDETDSDDDARSLENLEKTLKVHGCHLSSRLMELNRQSTRRSEFTFPIKVELARK